MAKKKAKTSSLSRTTNVKTYQLMIFLILFALVGAYSLVQTFAAPPSKGGGGKSNGSTMTYSMVKDSNSNGTPNWGDVIRFNPVTTVTTQPHVRLLCYQNGTLVYNGMTGYFEGYPWPWTQEQSLMSGAWTSGGADCSATMYYFNGKRTADILTITFRVDA